MDDTRHGKIFTNLLPAARAALRRKKQHEHTLDQTVAQISTLEQQIYSIEAANINRETLAAMERAGEAMQQIHGKLNIDKVDETMYVCPRRPSSHDDGETGLTSSIGRNYESSMHLARRSQAPSRMRHSVRLLMRASSTTSWNSWSRSSWTTRC